MFKIYTVKLGNTAICKSGNKGARRVVLAFFSRVKMRQVLREKITGKVNIYFVTH